MLLGSKINTKKYYYARKENNLICGYAGNIHDNKLMKIQKQNLICFVTFTPDVEGSSVTSSTDKFRYVWASSEIFGKGVKLCLFHKKKTVTANFWV